MRNVLFAAGIVASSAASAQLTTVVDLSGSSFNGEPGSPLNEVFNVNLGANAMVTGVGFDITLEAFSPSWLSEATIALEDSAQTAGLFLTPAVGNDGPGAGSFSSGGVIDLSDVDGMGLDLTFSVGADGILRIELFDTFDDFFSPQATISSGSVTIQYIPAPASAALLGLGGLAAARRRR